MTIQEFNKTKIGVKRPPFSKEWKDKLSKSHLGQIKSQETIAKYKKTMEKNGGVWNKGKKMSKEFCEKTSKGHIGIKHTNETKQKHRELMSGSNNHQWKGGIESGNVEVRDSREYKYWRKQILLKFNFICQKCLVSGGKLECHHINNFADFPELRLDIENGTVMCKEHHKEFHKIYGVKNNTLEQLLEYIGL